MPSREAFASPDNPSSPPAWAIPFGPLVPATFVRRDNRFRVQVRLDGRSVAAHLPNSGRLTELLVTGRRVWLAPADARRRERRRTAYDLMLVALADRLVSVDARLPTHLLDRAIRHGQVPPFKGYPIVRREVRRGHSRLDLRLEGGAGLPPCWIEAKSVTLVEEGVARFPDAPTLRGQRHLEELIEIVRAGERAAVVFVVQRDDADRFAPHDEADPAFGAALRRAAQAGVEVHAFRCHVSREAIHLTAAIPVLLPHPFNPFPIR